MNRWTKLAVLAIAGLIVLIQLIPVERKNPPVKQQVQWNSAETHELAQRACYDCHSNETVWPWYSYVAPISWRIIDHVNHGRRHLNFSDWDQSNEDLNAIIDIINSGEMPLSDYLLLHDEAKLSESDKQALIDGLKLTMQNNAP